MQVDRRDCMRYMLTGLTALSAGGFPLPLFANQAETKSQVSSRLTAKEFWKHVDQVKASNLVHSAINAARAGVQAQRAVNASKRAAILLGGEAGKDQMAQAEKQHELRTAELQKTKQALAEFGRTAGDSGETKFKEFVAKGGLKEALEHARRSTIRMLLHSDISPEEAQTAMKTIHDRIEKIQGINSFRELSAHLDQHLDELVSQKLSQGDPNDFCVFLLLITSLYVLLLVIALLICALLLGLVPCQSIFDQIIAQACP